MMNGIDIYSIIVIFLFSVSLIITLGIILYIMEDNDDE